MDELYNKVQFIVKSKLWTSKHQSFTKENQKINFVHDQNRFVNAIESLCCSFIIFLTHYAANCVDNVLLMVIKVFLQSLFMAESLLIATT